MYACPFAIHDNFLAGNILTDGGFSQVWKTSELFRSLREPQSAGACASCNFYDSCRGGCMAAKFFTGLPMDGPDPNVFRDTDSRPSKGTAPCRSRASTTHVPVSAPSVAPRQRRCP